VADFDVQAMIDRFAERAKAVRNRGVPPVEGPERKRFIEQAQADYMDYAMLADAEGELEDGVLTLRIDLRPQGDGS
jgi:limonene-1,2-epoxide hydrolase